MDRELSVGIDRLMDARDACRERVKELEAEVERLKNDAYWFLVGCKEAKAEVKWLEHELIVADTISTRQIASLCKSEAELQSEVTRLRDAARWYLSGREEAKAEVERLEHELIASTRQIFGLCKSEAELKSEVERLKRRLEGGKYDRPGKH